MKSVNIDIDTAGNVVIDSVGFAGGACEKATEAIELAIGGGEVKSKKKKPDFYKATSGNKAVLKRTF